MWFLLEEHKVGEPNGDENMINFDSFKNVGHSSGEKCRPFFNAVTFFKLYEGDYHGRISVMQFFNYVMRKVWLQQTRIGKNKTSILQKKVCPLVDPADYIH